MLPRRRANKSHPSRCEIFLIGRVVSVLWGLVGPGRGSKWSSVRPEAPGGWGVCAGRWERGSKQKRGRGLLEKRRGTSASLYFEGPSWQMRSGSDAIPDAAGGEGGHGAARPEGVIHRCLFNKL
jgi:hypothetical protein